MSRKQEKQSHRHIKIFIHLFFVEPHCKPWPDYLWEKKYKKNNTKEKQMDLKHVPPPNFFQFHTFETNFVALLQQNM